MTENHLALASLLVHQKRSLAAVRDAHVQLRLLVEAGDSRYLGWAVDDLTESVQQLHNLDARRQAITADTSVSEWITSAPDDIRRALVRLTDDLETLLSEISEERCRARAVTHARLNARSEQHR